VGNSPDSRRTFSWRVPGNPKRASEKREKKRTPAQRKERELINGSEEFTSKGQGP